MEHMATTLTDLPEEMLAKIFSFLNQKELPNLFLVCKKFNAAAKHPSLWRRGCFSFRYPNQWKIINFCNFFGQYSFFRALSLRGSDDGTLINSFNYLFHSLKHLKCLKFYFGLTDIVLPPSLRHLSINLSFSDRIEGQFRCLDQCPNIERLYLKGWYHPDEDKLTIPIRSMILKYQFTLSALYLGIGYFDEEWIPLIENCFNLKEFGLFVDSLCEEVNLANFFRSSSSSRLERLYVNNINTLQSFKGCKFPKLKFLFIESYYENLMRFLPIIKRMPKLQSLKFFGDVSNPNVGEFCSMIKSYVTLRYLSITNLASDSCISEGFIIKELNEGSSEEDQWVSSSEVPNEKLHMNNPCKCNCWNPSSEVSFDQLQHKQLRWRETVELASDDSYFGTEPESDNCDSDSGSESEGSDSDSGSDF